MLHFRYRYSPLLYEQGRNYFFSFRMKKAISEEVLIALRKEYSKELKLLRQEKISSYTYEKLKRKLRKRFFIRYDALLDQNIDVRDLVRPQMAEALEEAIMYHDLSQYFMLAYCIMPNHVHMVFHYPVSASLPLEKVLGSIKEYSNQFVRCIPDVELPFWEDAYFHFEINDRKEVDDMITYVLDNPVKAGYVGEWKEWRYSYLLDLD